MSYWNAKYRNALGEYEITFASKSYEKTKVVEKICQAVMDDRIRTPEELESKLRVFKSNRIESDTVKGCEWCESLNKKTEDFKCGDVLARGVVEHTFWGDGRWYMQEPKFCPMCGRRLEDT